MSSIYLIDYYSNSLQSYIHRLNIVSKLIFLSCVLLSIILAKSLFILALFFVVINLLILMANLPIFKILKWSLYPAFFAILFALSQLNSGWILPLQTIFKAIDAALLVLLIICTTPYPDFFSLTNKFSHIIAAVMFMAYRFFFLVVDEVQTKIKLLKIRGGYAGGFSKTLKNVGVMLGHLFIHSTERSENIYNLLTIRGYRGKIFRKTAYKFQAFDVLFIAIGIVFIISSFKAMWS